MTRASVVGLLVLAAAACATRKASPPGQIEVRGKEGEIVLTAAPAAGGWDVTVPGEPVLRAVPSPDGAKVTRASGEVVAELAPGAAGFRMTAAGKTYRVVFASPRRVVHVLDDVGVTIMAYEQVENEAMARDATTRPVAFARKDGDRVVVTAGTATLASVAHLPPDRDRHMEALLLAGKELPPSARAALFAYVHSSNTSR